MGNLKALLLDFWSTGKGLISKIALSLVSAAAAFGAVKELSEGTTGNWGYFFLATAILSWFVLIGLYFKRSKVASIYDSRNRLIREVSRSPYSDRSRLYIGIAIIAFPFIVVLTSYGWWRWQNLPSDKFIILVTKFEEDGQQFGLTDGIYEELTNSTASYPEVQIKQLNEIIKIQKGGKNARQKGVDAKASIVLWGGYIKTPEKVRLKIRVEILRDLIDPNVSQLVTKLIRPVEELYGFELQDRVASDMTYLSLLCVGIARLDAKDDYGAIDRFTRAISRKGLPVIAGAYTDVYWLRGIAFLNKDDLDLAISDFDTAIMREPETPISYYFRSIARNNKRDYGDAINDINKYIELVPDTSIGYVMKGHVLCNKGDFDKAIQEITEPKDFGRIKEVDYPLAYTVRGWAHLNKKSPEAALVDFDEALRLNADLAIALAFRADVHRQKRDYKKAEADLKRAIKLQPENSLVYAQFAMYYDDLNDYPRAIGLISRAIDLRPRNDDFRLQRGRFHYVRKAFGPAEADFEEALRIIPDNYEALHWRGMAHSRNKEYDRCIDLLTRAVELRPDRANYYVTLSSCLSSKGDLSRALANADMAIRLAPTLDGGYYQRGDILSKLGKKEDAAAAFRKFLEVSTDPNMIREAEDRLKALATQ